MQTKTGRKAHNGANHNAFNRHIASLAVMLGCVLFLVAPNARSGRVDCSLIYDEYDSLMSAGFLQMPGDYVAGYDGWLSQPAFDTLQRGRFVLHPERGESGVMVFRTNHNRHGKLLYYWTDPLADGRRYLMISEAAWYARVADGAGLELFGRLRANSGRGIDLDTLALVELPADEDELSDDVINAAEAVAGSSPGDAELTPGPGPEPGPQVATEMAVPGNTGLQFADNDLDGGATTSPGLPLNGAGMAQYVVMPVDPALSPDMADLAVLLDEQTGIYHVSAINGARLFFPTESLCIAGTGE